MNKRSLRQVHPASADEEVVEPLLERPGLRLERIISYGHASPSGFWYDQEQEEWVMLAHGTAILEVQDQEPLELSAGDYLLIPAHCRHRVAWVSEDAVWLALHVT